MANLSKKWLKRDSKEANVDIAAITQREIGAFPLFERAVRVDMSRKFGGDKAGEDWIDDKIIEVVSYSEKKRWVSNTGRDARVRGYPTGRRERPWRGNAREGIKYRMGRILRLAPNCVKTFGTQSFPGLVLY